MSHSPSKLTTSLIGELFTLEKQRDEKQKQIKTLQQEIRVIDTKLAELRSRPVDYFKAKQRMQKRVLAGLQWAEGLTEGWRKKYNHKNLVFEQDQIPI